jgi:hypothetical protein
MTDEDIRRRLRGVRHSLRADRYGRHIQSINAVAIAAGLSRKQIYRICNGSPIGPRARMGLNRVLSCDVTTGETFSVHPGGLKDR